MAEGIFAAGGGDIPYCDGEARVGWESAIVNRKFEPFIPSVPESQSVMLVDASRWVQVSPTCALF